MLTRDVGVSDIPLLRYMAKAGSDRVVKLDATPESRFEFLVQLTNDLGNTNGFSDYTTTGLRGLTPSTYYQKLCNNDPAIPTFYMASLIDGELTNIQLVTSKGLNELIKGKDWGAETDERPTPIDLPDQAQKRALDPW